MRAILVAYGEYELASDEALLHEMIDAADVTTQSMDLRVAKADEGLVDATPKIQNDLDASTFAEGLTSDLRLYDLRNETRFTTNIDDVFLSHHLGTHSAKSSLTTDSERKDIAAAQEIRERLAVGRPLVRKNTLPSIDVTAGTYRSKGLMVSLWTTVLLTYFA